MPPLETSSLHQTAVLWPYAGTDRYGQNTRVTNATEIPVRWVYGEDEGEQRARNANVLVDRQIEIGSLMWLGTYEEWLLAEETDDNNLVMRVVTYRETPDVLNREVARRVRLLKYAGAIPRSQVIGSASESDLTIFATGFTSLGCALCEALNEDWRAYLTINRLNYQEWRSSFFALDYWTTGTGTGTGTVGYETTGTGTCALEWQWRVERDLRAGTITLFASNSIGQQAVWYSTASWNGIDPITLALTDGSDGCSWPATLTMQSVSYRALTGAVQIRGAGFLGGSCGSCSEFNRDFECGLYQTAGEWKLWKSSDFTAAGSTYFWYVNTYSGGVNIQLRSTSNFAIGAVWAYTASTWDEITEIAVPFSGASAGNEDCCKWPALLRVRGY